MREHSKDYLRYFFIVLFLGMLTLSFLIVKPYMAAILTGIIASYIFYPLYVKINKRIHKDNISATLVILIAILIITVPFLFMINTITKESYVMYLLAKQRITSGELFISCDGQESMLCSLSRFSEDILKDPKTRYQLEDTIQKVTKFIIDSMSSFVLSIPSLILNLFIMVFVMFYLVRDGKDLYAKFRKLIPLAKSHKERVLAKFNDITHAVVYGTIIVAAVQGAFGALGLIIFGFPSPILWGIMMMITSMLPFIGPPLIWIPIVGIHLLNALSANDSTQITRGIIMILYFSLIVGTVDNILKPKIVGNKSQVHPVLILLGVVGGISVFGLIGVIIGPVILAVFTAFLQIYESEKGKLFFLK